MSLISMNGFESLRLPPSLILMYVLYAIPLDILHTKSLYISHKRKPK